jgi:hypothetical protein
MTTTTTITTGFTSHTVAYVNEAGGFEFHEETHRIASPIAAVPSYDPLPGCTTYIVAYMNDAGGFFHEGTSCILKNDAK